MKKLFALILAALSFGANAQTLVQPLNGGTGIKNSNSATVTSSGAFAYTRTLTGATNVTFPTSGTLATTAGTVATATNLAGGPGIPFNASAGVTSFDNTNFAYDGTTFSVNSKLSINKTAGAGPTFSMGTATTDVGARWTQTWNNVSQLFTAIDLNVTDTTSDPSSSLINLRVGGTTKFNVTKAGGTTVVGNLTVNGGTVRLASGTTLDTASGGITIAPQSAITAVTGALTVSTNITSANLTVTALGSDAATTNNTACVTATTGVFTKGSGAIGICLGTSSERYKTQIASLDAGLSEIMKLRPVSYYLDREHGNPEKLLYGFTAEQGGSVLPDLLGRDSQGRANTFDYMGVVPVLVRAVQQLNEKIEGMTRQ